MTINQIITLLICGPIGLMYVIGIVTTFANAARGVPGTISLFQTIVLVICILLIVLSFTGIS